MALANAVLPLKTSFLVKRFKKLDFDGVEKHTKRTEGNQQVPIGYTLPIITASCYIRRDFAGFIECRAQMHSVLKEHFFFKCMSEWSRKETLSLL